MRRGQRPRLYPPPEAVELPLLLSQTVLAVPPLSGSLRPQRRLPAGAGTYDPLYADMLTLVLLPSAYHEKANLI